MRHRGVPVASAGHNRRYADARRVLIAVLRDETRGTRVVGRVREERFLSRDEVAQVRLHRRDIRLRLRVGELRDRNRGQDADDDDHDEQLDEREALASTKHGGHGVYPDWGYGVSRCTLTPIRDRAWCRAALKQRVRPTPSNRLTA